MRYAPILQKALRSGTLTLAAKIVRTEPKLPPFSPHQRETVADTLDVMAAEIKAQSDAEIKQWKAERKAAQELKNKPDSQ